MSRLSVVRHEVVARTGAGGRLVELDGLRALAILGVIFEHCCPTEGWWKWVFLGQTGWMGVDLFFVLSGYLITGILLNTVHSRYYYRNFIVRRTLRIFPLYYACLLVFTIGARLDHAQYEALKAWGGAGWFYVWMGNLHTAWRDGGPAMFSFGPLWSLQVEEQFYLLFPAAVFLLSPLRLRRLLIACVITAPLLRTFLLLFVSGSVHAAFVLMPYRMDSLALGGLVALLMRSPAIHTYTLRQLTFGALLSGSVLTIFGIAISPAVMSPFMTSFGYTILDLTCAIVLLIVLRWPSLRAVKWLRWRPLVYTGQISYGLYLLHAPAGWAARTVIGKLAGVPMGGHSGAAAMLIEFGAAFAAASLSWHFFESRILSFKERLTRSEPRWNEAEELLAVGTEI